MKVSPPSPVETRSGCQPSAFADRTVRVRRAGDKPSLTCTTVVCHKPHEGGGWRKHGRKPAVLLGSGGRVVLAGCDRVADGLLIGLERVFGRVEAVVSLGAELLRRRAGLSSPVLVEREAVDHQCIPEQVQELTFVAEAVGAAEPEAVVEVTVDALRIVASRVEASEVGIVSRDGPDVLGSVQFPCRVFGCAVEADGDDTGAVPVRDHRPRRAVVSAVRALVSRRRRSSSVSVGSRSTTSRSTAGSSTSRRTLRTLPDRAGAERRCWGGAEVPARAPLDEQRDVLTDRARSRY